jgi:hypothetical protein
MPLLVLSIVLLVPAVLEAQRPGPAAFRVYERGQRVGDVEMRLERLDDGWRLTGRSHIEGTTPVTITRIDLEYDAAWQGRFLTLALQAHEEALLQVAVTGTTTRTDIMRPDRVHFRSSSVSPDTIFLPEQALGAYEAVAARLTDAGPGTSLPLFLVPDSETRALVERVASQQVQTERGPLAVTRYWLTEVRGGPTPIEVWVDQGRLLRLDLPRRQLTMLRDDVR